MITTTVDGLEFSFERRKYGRTTYTWASVKHGEEWIDLGDPWPCLNPKKAELLEAAKCRLANMDTYRR